MTMNGQHNGCGGGSQVFTTGKTLRQALDEMFSSPRAGGGGGGSLARRELKNAAIEEQEQATPQDDVQSQPERPKDKVDLKVQSPALGKQSQPQQAQKSPTESELESGDVTLETIKDKINSIRAGKSLKDTAVAAATEQYFNKLTEAERTALLEFLNAISQLVTGSVDGTSVAEPSDAPANVAMQKSGAEGQQPGKTSVRLKPTVVKRTPNKQPPGVPGSEDASGPVPIKPTPR